MDIQTPAAKSFWREVRTLSERTKSWQAGIRHEIAPDERWDASLISARVYGRRDEFLAVMAAAGVDTFDRPLTQRSIILPTLAQLAAIKRRAGFESQADYREDGAPIWAN